MSAIRHRNFYYTYWGDHLIGGKPKKSVRLYSHVVVQVSRATGLAKAQYATTLDKAVKILNGCDRADYKYLELYKIHPVSLDDFRTKETTS